MTDVAIIRQALLEALPKRLIANHGEIPAPHEIYIPLAHNKALRLDSSLVVGARGVGKSFWTAALNSSALRSSIGQVVRDLDNADVHIGFAVAPNIDAYPNDDTFVHLLVNGAEPFDVWRAVVVRWLAKKLGNSVPVQTWPETVEWVKSNPESVARLMQASQMAFATERRIGLIVFDALDRTSNDWRQMDAIVRDLLRVVLWLMSFANLRAKVFLREDQFGRTITDFPDASKLLATKAELTWAPHDLHGLLWQHFSNAPDGSGECLRALYEEVVGRPPERRDGIWHIADTARRDTPTQRSLFARLAGPWMGKDRRRGIPYIWTVSHLADGKQRTSPRSLVAAIHAAAEDSIEKYPEHPHALHYESIKRGVQSASETRVTEMAEDFPWVPTIMGPLRGLTVPCDPESIADHWRNHFPDGPASVNSGGLPPQHSDRGWPGIRDDLERLGIVETMKDGRVNLPDLYRVGFGLGRRGGVRPLR